MSARGQRAAVAATSCASKNTETKGRQGREAFMFKKREKNTFTLSEQLCNPNAKKKWLALSEVQTLKAGALVFKHQPFCSPSSRDNGCEGHFSHILKQFASPAAPTWRGPTSEPLNMMLIVVVKPMKRECL